MERVLEEPRNLCEGTLELSIFPNLGYYWKRTVVLRERNANRVTVSRVSKQDDALQLLVGAVFCVRGRDCDFRLFKGLTAVDARSSQRRRRARIPLVFENGQDSLGLRTIVNVVKSLRRPVRVRWNSQKSYAGLETYRDTVVKNRRGQRAQNADGAADKIRKRLVDLGATVYIDGPRFSNDYGRPGI